MLNANKVDSDKITARITEIMEGHKDSPNSRFIFVDLNKFYESCGLSQLRKSKFVEEVADALTYSTFVRTYGEWLFCEYGDGFHAFIFVADVPKGIDNLVAECVAYIHKF